jgi:catalase
MPSLSQHRQVGIGSLEGQVMTAVDFAAIPQSAETSPSKAWREIIEPDEQALFRGFADEIKAQQRDAAAKTGGALGRGFHAKLHAGLIAEFEILNDLPACARQGVFSTPRVFPAVVRFSNGEPTHHPDKYHEPRGIAIKLMGVSGRRLLPGDADAVTQDFLATSHSVTSTVRNVKQFMAFIRASQKPRTMLFTLWRSVGLRETFRILRALVRTVGFSKVRSLATEKYSGTAPIKFGPYAVKFTVRPAVGTEATVRRTLTRDFLRDELADRLRQGDLRLDFLVQFYVDETRTPIEDTSIVWDAPLLKVGQLRIPSCDLDDPQTRAVSNAVDQLSFSPWHAIEDHRPLGSVMRARRVAYQTSATLRGHSPEPTGLPLIGPPSI